MQEDFSLLTYLLTEDVNELDCPMTRHREIIWLGFGSHFTNIELESPEAVTTRVSVLSVSAHIIEYAYFEKFKAIRLVRGSLYFQFDLSSVECFD